MLGRAKAEAARAKVKIAEEELQVKQNIASLQEKEQRPKHEKLRTNLENTLTLLNEKKELAAEAELEVLNSSEICSRHSEGEVEDETPEVPIKVENSEHVNTSYQYKNVKEPKGEAESLSHFLLKKELVFS